MKREARTLLFVAGLWACDGTQQETAETPPAQTVADGAKAEATARGAGPELDIGAKIDASAMAVVFGGYDTVRAKLAADDLNVAGDAMALSESALAAAEASAGAADLLRAVAKESARLAELDGNDVQRSREQFGEVSRALITVLERYPELREGLFVFECPMASKYKKWIQSDAQLANPYMGTQMLECGGESEWSA